MSIGYHLWPVFHGIVITGRTAFDISPKYTCLLAAVKWTHQGLVPLKILMLDSSQNLLEEAIGKEEKGSIFLSIKLTWVFIDQGLLCRYSLLSREFNKPIWGLATWKELGKQLQSVSSGVLLWQVLIFFAPLPWV